MNKRTFLIEFVYCCVAIVSIVIGYFGTDGLRNTLSYSFYSYLSYYWGILMVIGIMLKYIYLLTRILLKDWIINIIKETK